MRIAGVVLQHLIYHGERQLGLVHRAEHPKELLTHRWVEPTKAHHYLHRSRRVSRRPFRHISIDRIAHRKGVRRVGANDLFGHAKHRIRAALAVLVGRHQAKTRQRAVGVLCQTRPRRGCRFRPLLIAKRRLATTVLGERLTRVGKLALDLSCGIARVLGLDARQRLRKRHVASKHESRVGMQTAGRLRRRAVEDLIGAHQLRELLQIGHAERRIGLVARRREVVVDVVP